MTSVELAVTSLPAVPSNEVPCEFTVHDTVTVIELTCGDDVSDTPTDADEQLTPLADKSAVATRRATLLMLDRLTIEAARAPASAACRTCSVAPPERPRRTTSSSSATITGVRTTSSTATLPLSRRAAR